MAVRVHSRYLFVEFLDWHIAPYLIGKQGIAFVQIPPNEGGLGEFNRLL